MMSGMGWLNAVDGAEFVCPRRGRFCERGFFMPMQQATLEGLNQYRVRAAGGVAG